MERALEGVITQGKGSPLPSLKGWIVGYCEDPKRVIHEKRGGRAPKHGCFGWTLDRMEGAS